MVRHALGRLLAVLVATVLFLGDAAVAKFLEPADENAPLIAPLGITLSSVRTGELAASGFNGTLAKTAQTVFADAAGMTLYYIGGEKSDCDEACLADWKPLVATGEPAGEWGWSIITDPTGVHQLAYQGKPLFTYVKDTVPGQAAGHGISGRRVVVIQHPYSAKLPDGISIAAMNEAPGEVLATADGFPMYAFSGKHRDASGKCAPSPCGAWKPIVAPALAHAVGEFTIIAYDPGVRQWAFRGRPLYRYEQDVDAGDVRGENLDGEMKVALLARYFMPSNVDIRPNHFGGVSLVTSQSMTLYTRDAANPAQGQSLRIGIRGNPATGRRLGTNACDERCTRTWLPLVAPADAIAAGYWVPLTREGGQKQWAYNGYALYSYTGDTVPGDINGFDIYEYAQLGDTSARNLKDERPVGLGLTGVGGAGLGQLHWRAAVP